MKTKSKALLLSLCMILLAVASVFGTLAYLTDTKTVTNTFTVGKVGLVLNEAKVNPDGTAAELAERVTTNTYHLLPGHTYIKDPTVTVAAESEDAYVRMIVNVEGIDQLETALTDSKYYAEDETFLLQMLCGGWDENTWVYEGYTQAEGSTTGVYEFRYKEVVDKSDNATKLPALFETITVPGEIDGTQLANLANVKIVVNAHAIQADGFTDTNNSGSAADEAWATWEN